MQDYQSVIYHMQKFNLPFDVKKYFSKKDINKIVYFMTTSRFESEIRTSMYAGAFKSYCYTISRIIWFNNSEKIST